MHKCTRATVTVHICTVTVVLLYIILTLFLSFLDSLHLQLNHHNSAQAPTTQRQPPSANHTDLAPPPTSS